MENRLKRLQEEEARAAKNKLAAEKKADLMMAARNRHYEDLKSKIGYYNQKKASENALRM